MLQRVVLTILKARPTYAGWNPVLHLRRARTRWARRIPPDRPSRSTRPFFRSSSGAPTLWRNSCKIFSKVTPSALTVSPDNRCLSAYRTHAHWTDRYDHLLANAG